MNQHPARTMLLVWGFCIATYFVMPYQLLDRQLTIKGLMILAVLITTFLVGTAMVPTRRSVSQLSSPILINANRAEMLLVVASSLATVFLMIDIQTKDIFDFSSTYNLRSIAANALLNADTSSSSLWFRLAFLLYPAAIVYLSVHALYARRVRI